MVKYIKKLNKFFLFSLFLAIQITSCVPAEKLNISGYVDLDKLEPVVSTHQILSPLRVAVASVVSPKGTIQSYESLMNYLETYFNRPVELIQRRTYLEMNDLINAGEVDLAFVCTSAYIKGHDEFGMELLVGPQVNGETTYYSYLIVQKDSAFQSMADLQGKVFAFTDPISLTGTMYPVYLIQQLGFTTENFFSTTFFTYNHDEAIRAVETGLADGAGVDSLVFDFAVARNPDLLNHVKIIDQSPAFGIPPVIVSPKLDPDLKIELQKVLLSMNFSSEGKKVLDDLGIDAFVPMEDQTYDEVRNFLSKVE